MSRLEQGQGELLRNPAKRFLEFKNMYSKEEVTIKGKTKEVKVFDKCGFNWSEKVGEEWVQNFVELPLEFAVLNGDWVNFKGWSETEKCKYWSNEVKTADDLISIRNKDGIVYEFTLNQMWGKVKGSTVKDEAMSKKVKADLKGLNVKQHSSIYVAIKNEETEEFELINLQIKGANLSGVKDTPTPPSGWWNFSKKYKSGNSLYTNYVQINDWTVEDGELGEYGVLNFTLGSKISADENEEIETLYQEMEAYHKFYTDKPKETVVEAEKVLAAANVDEDDEPDEEKLPF